MGKRSKGREERIAILNGTYRQHPSLTIHIPGARTAEVVFKPLTKNHPISPCIDIHGRYRYHLVSTLLCNPSHRNSLSFSFIVLSVGQASIFAVNATGTILAGTRLCVPCYFYQCNDSCCQCCNPHSPHHSAQRHRTSRFLACCDGHVDCDTRAIIKNCGSLPSEAGTEHRYQTIHLPSSHCTADHLLVGFTISPHGSSHHDNSIYQLIRGL